MTDGNRTWYSTLHAATGFAVDDLLEPALVLLLLRYHAELAGRAILDLGVGAGRTTRYLTAITSHYVGIDYSPSMVERCAQRFPSARIELGDARDLNRFADATFDVALFSAAGISTQDHASRLKVLAEVARVLRPGGIFMFSAHNRRHGPGPGPQLAFARNPLTLVANAIRWKRSIWRHHRMRRLEREFPEYALANDAADGYRLLHYYIGPDEQRAQLQRTGLTTALVCDSDGVEVSPGAGAPHSDRKSVV